MFEKGEGVLINEEEAIKFYTKSIELGYSLMLKTNIKSLIIQKALVEGVLSSEKNEQKARELI